MKNSISSRLSVTSVVVIMLVSTMGLLLSSTTMLLHSNQHEAIAQQQSYQSSSSLSILPDVVTIQNTSMSVPAPSAAVNKQSIPHQIVIALPLRDDGKVWSGKVTFTASKPIEIEVIHKYNPKIAPDAIHGAPYNGKWVDNTTSIALPTMTQFSNTPVSVTNSPIM